MCLFMDDEEMNFLEQYLKKAEKDRIYPRFDTKSSKIIGLYIWKYNILQPFQQNHGFLFRDVDNMRHWKHDWLCKRPRRIAHQSY